MHSFLEKVPTFKNVVVKYTVAFNTDRFLPIAPRTSPKLEAVTRYFLREDQIGLSRCPTVSMAT